jgi:hypothetical protein
MRTLAHRSAGTHRIPIVDYGRTLFAHYRRGARAGRGAAGAAAGLRPATSRIALSAAALQLPELRDQKLPKIELPVGDEALGQDTNLVLVEPTEDNTGVARPARPQATRSMSDEIDNISVDLTPCLIERSVEPIATAPNCT